MSAVGCVCVRVLMSGVGQVGVKSIMLELYPGCTRYSPERLLPLRAQGTMHPNGGGEV